MLKNKLFDTELGKLEILVSYDEETKKHPIREEDFHGIHIFDEDEVIISLLSVEIVLPYGFSIDILPKLTERQKQYIIDFI